ncbi:hypothetical protein OHR68_29745 [Spirillospora sp. NBC_00431]
MKLGYSFWGFLGTGITDTPDGGRSHRRTLIDGLTTNGTGLGHNVVFLQPNRDLTEAGQDLRDAYTWNTRLPDIDALFCEWRWPIHGRNTTPCGSPGHTCDLHRQSELIDHYTHRQQTPTFIWDKDLQLPADHQLRHTHNVTVCEAALHPKPGAAQLLFPVADFVLDHAASAVLAALPRDLPLVYVGNQYDRDEPFDRFFAPVAAAVPHLVAGKWTSTERWPQVDFIGRIPFPDVERLYRRALATMLLAPDRLAVQGQFTQRLFEAVLAGCLPLAPSYLRSVETLVPGELIVDDAQHALTVLTRLTAIAGSNEHAELIDRCLRLLAPFRLSRQLTTLDRLLNEAAPNRGAAR